MILIADPYIIFPLLGGVIGLITAVFSLLWFKRQCSRKIPVNTTCASPSERSEIRAMWQENGLDQELEPLLERRLEGMIDAMKEQIPMAGMLISKAREDKLKAQAHIELVKAIPEIKQIILHHLEVRPATEGQIRPQPGVSKPKCLISYAVASTVLGAILGFLFQLAAF